MRSYFLWLAGFYLFTSGMFRSDLGKIMPGVCLMIAAFSS